MALTDYMYPPDLPKEQYNNFGLQQLLGTIQGIAQASQPSRLKAQPLQVLAGGLGGALQGSNNAMGQMALMQKIKDEQVKAKMLQDAQAQQAAFRREVSGIPQTSIIEDQANQRSTQVQRPLADIMGDYSRTAMKYDPKTSIDAFEALTKTAGKTGDVQITEVPIDGKMHRVLINKPSGEVIKDYGANIESFKPKNIIGRGGLSKRPILQSTENGQLIYADNQQPVPPEDSTNMRPVTVRGLDSSQVSDLANLRNTYNRLTDVAGRAAKMPDKFGFLNGRWNNIKLKFQSEGATQTVQNELKSMITIAYGLSGKQISEREMEMLKDALLPALEQPYGNFQATLNFAKDWVGKTHDDRLQYFNENNFDTNSKPILGGKSELPPVEKPTKKTITRTGKDKSGRKVVQYSDGSIEYVQ